MMQHGARMVAIAPVTLVIVVISLLCASFANCEQTGQPLYLSKYLPNNPDQARQMSKVDNIGNYTSYSGLFTVNEALGSNMYFWFFPAQNGNTSAPILLWLQGGPGASSMTGVFVENGPFFTTEDGQGLAANPYTWNAQYNMLYIDNPVGVGFSFTQDDRGFARNEEDVANNIYSALTQFFQVFSAYKTNDFYVTGESYGGKYVPSVAYKIHQMNKNSNNAKISLAGISIGDGMMEPRYQTQGYAKLWYFLSLADSNEVAGGEIFENIILENIIAQRYEEAFKYFDMYMNGDFYPYPTYYKNVTGLTSYFNFLTPTYPPNPYVVFLNKNSTRNAIHVGDLPFHNFNGTVESYLKADWMKSVGHLFPTLLNNYKVLVYNGQNDIILGGALAEPFYKSIPWTGQDDYLKAQKVHWKLHPLDLDPAGYARQVNNFVQVIIRDAGHLVPQDQPQRALDMIERFISGRSFAN